MVWGIVNAFTASILTKIFSSPEELKKDVVVLRKMVHAMIHNFYSKQQLSTFDINYDIIILEF